MARLIWDEMNLLNLITDPYDRSARLYPALLLIAPEIVIVTTAMSGDFIKSLGTTVAGCGGAFLLSQLARDAGKNCENALYQKWGGTPSVTIFRHRDTRLDAITKARYHKKMASIVKETTTPSIEEEQADPAASDKIYAAWSTYLRINTRDTKKFSLLFRELTNYGFRRNIFGLRLIGIITTALCCAVSAIWLYFLFKTTGKIVPEVTVSLLFSTVFLFLWIFQFSSDWVRIPADAYAERLAETIGYVEKSKK